MNPRLRRFRAGAPASAGGFAFPASARRWSDVAAWGLGGKPVSGASVVIMDNVILDERVDLGPTGSVTFMGNGDPSSCGLYWDHTVFSGVSLTAGSLQGMGKPTFWCGEPGTPFPMNGSFMELSAAPGTATAREGGYGFSNDGVARGFMWDGPVTVEAAGPTKLWTKLNANITTATSTFQTADDVSDWPVGARFAIAPSGYHNPGGNETKIFTIASRTSSQIVANETTAYPYWGVLQYPVDAADGTSGVSLTQGAFTRKAHANTPTVIDERAEICLLSDGKSLEWRAPNDSYWTADIGGGYTQQFGFHAMFTLGSVQKIRGPVIRRGGQAGLLGRYPIHSHMASYKTTTTVVTIDTTNGNTVHWVGHPLQIGQPVKLTTFGTLLTGLRPSDLPNPEAKFYVVSSGFGVDSFSLALFAGDTTLDIPYPLAAAPITASGSQSGQHSATVTLFDHDLTGEYWDRLRIDESGNRFGSVHGTCGLTVSNNIGIDCKGMGWFFGEDGVEIRNKYRYNIGGKVRPPKSGNHLMAFDLSALLTEDLNGPSAFWLTHPDNEFVGNRGFDATRNGLHNAFCTLPNGASRLVRLNVLAERKNPTLYQDNVSHSNGVNVAETPNASGNRFGIFDRFHYPAEYVWGDIVRDLPANMPHWERTFGYKCNGNGYNHSVPAPWLTGWTMCDNVSLDFIGGTNPSGLLEQMLLVAYTLNTIGSPMAYNVVSDSDYTKHYGMTSYHGLAQMKDNTYINYVWQAGHLHRQFDSGGGAFSSRDCYLMGVFINPADWTNNTFINSHGGYLSQSPSNTPEGSAPSGPMPTTTLTVAAAAGSTSVTLASVANCVVNGTCGVVLDNGDTWYMHIASIAGNVVTFRNPSFDGNAGALPYNASAGNQVRVSTFLDVGVGRGPLRSYTIAQVLSNETGIYGPTTYTAGGGRYYATNLPFYVSGQGPTHAPRMAVAGENGVLIDKGYFGVGGSGFTYRNAIQVDRYDPTNLAGGIVASVSTTSGYETYLFSGFRYVAVPDGAHIRVSHPGRIPQGSNVNGAADRYNIDFQGTDRTDCDFSCELPWDAAAVPTPSYVMRARRDQNSGMAFDWGPGLASSPPSIRIMSALDLSTIPGGVGATKQQIVTALRSDTYNPVADKFWMDTTNQTVVFRIRGYNADGVTRNIDWNRGISLITDQNYRERNLAFWLFK